MEGEIDSSYQFVLVGTCGPRPMVEGEGKVLSRDVLSGTFWEGVTLVLVWDNWVSLLEVL